ncbi:MAG: capsule biosynthesis protein CapA, partial [Pseudomonadota bacterium]
MLKVGFCRADDREWRGAGPYQAFTDRPEAWRAWLDALIAERGLTDVVLYGDARPYHAEAIRAARAAGLRVHCFEEGYLRPFWITYERDGTNGASKLMDLDAAALAEASRMADYDVDPAPPIWGAAWRHAYHGLRHHFDLLARNGAYPHYRPHRELGLGRELALYLKRLVVLPLLYPQRRWRERRLLNSGKLYHLVLLQMAIDSSMGDHSAFDSVGAFVDRCLEAFAAGAPRDHHLVFKAHPFEDGRERLERRTRAAARRLGVADRVTFLQGGKLGPLLDRARSAVTVNST